MHELKARTKIYAGNSNFKLAEEIAEVLSARLSARELGKFSDGETRCELLEHVRDNYIFLIQSTCNPVNDHLFELFFMADAVRRQGTSNIVAVMPYYGYSRQDRKPGFTRTPISSSLVARFLEKAGITHVLTIDIHSEQQLGFFNIPVINISASPELVGDIWRHYAYDKAMMIVSPDTGGVVRARSVAKQLDDADLAIVDKRRPKANVSEVMNIIGDVKGRKCIMIDDMIDTAGTLCKAAKALVRHGAIYVAAYATHAVFSGNAYQNIVDTPELDEIVVTDTIPLSPDMKNLGKIRQISVANLLAETMYRLRSRKSVSEIYTGS